MGSQAGEEGTGQLALAPPFQIGPLVAQKGWMICPGLQNQWVLGLGMRALWLSFHGLSSLPWNSIFRKVRVILSACGYRLCAHCLLTMGKSRLVKDAWVDGAQNRMVLNAMGRGFDDVFPGLGTSWVSQRQEDASPCACPTNRERREGQELHGRVRRCCGWVLFAAHLKLSQHC